MEKPASSAVNVHFVRRIQKSFPTTRATRTTTNKPFLRPGQKYVKIDLPINSIDGRLRQTHAGWVPLFCLSVICIYDTWR